MFQLQLFNSQSTGYGQQAGAASPMANSSSNGAVSGAVGAGFGQAQGQSNQPFLWLLNSASASLAQQAGMAGSSPATKAAGAFDNLDLSGMDFAALEGLEGESLPPGLLPLLGKGLVQAQGLTGKHGLDTESLQAAESALADLGLDAVLSPEGLTHLAEQLSAYQQGQLEPVATGFIEGLMAETGLNLEQLEQGLAKLQTMTSAPAEQAVAQAVLQSNVSVQLNLSSPAAPLASQAGAQAASVATSLGQSAVKPATVLTGSAQTRITTKQDGAMISSGTLAGALSGASGPSAAAFDAEAAKNSAQASTNLGLSQAIGLNSLVSESDISFKQALSQTMQSPAAAVQAEQEIGDLLGDTATDIAEEGLTKADASRAADLQNRQAQQALKPYTTNVFSQVGEPDWSEEMNEKVMWLSSRNIKSAQIQLNPVELGPVEVKVSVQNDQTSISFNVQNANVRELLEANVHRLREMMDGNGVALADVNVGSEQGFAAFAQSQGQEQDGSKGQAGTGTDGSNGESEDTQVLAQTALSSDRLVDERV